MKRCALLLLAGWLATATAQPLPPAPQARLRERPGATLPLDLPLTDDLGQPVRLRDSFHPGQPVLLVLGYYRCQQLCGLLMHGLLEGLQASGLPRSDWRIVGVSIDPADAPADARRRRELDLAYAAFIEGAHPAADELHLDLRVAGANESARLARSVGYAFQPLPPARPGGAAQFAHPATVVVATPEGRVSRYFNGMRFDGAELRGALVEAAGGRIGSVGDRLALLCAHFDPVIGRYSDAVMNAARLAGALALAGLAWLAWRHRTPRGRR